MLGLWVSFVVERTQNQDLILRGVVVSWRSGQRQENAHDSAGKNGGPGRRSLRALDAMEAERVLSNLAIRFANRTIELRLGEQRKQVPVRRLGLELEVQSAGKEALAAGRRGNGISQFGFWLMRLFSDYEIEPEVRLDREQLQEFVRPWAAKKLPEKVLPAVLFEEVPRAEYGRAGSSVDFEVLEKRLLTAVNEGSSAPVSVPVVRNDPLISRSEVERAVAQARRILDAPIRLESEDGKHQQTVLPAQLRPALRSEVEQKSRRLLLGIAVERLRPVLRPLLSRLEQPARDAAFKMGSKGKITIRPSHEGIRLDSEALASAILKSGSSGSRTVPVPLEPEPPELTTLQAESLGITELVASFSTRHSCCRPRVENIQTAARRLDGLILRPGERFSLNEFLGRRTEAKGYKQAPTIVRGEMKKTVGGGISQFATTLFNAVLDAGYEVLQRQPHSYYFPRYPEGHEATISFPQPDLIFKNDTDAGLLIKTVFGPTFIKVLLYGDTEGRQVSRQRSKRYDVVHPPIEYEADEELEPGERKRVRAGQLGWTVLVSRTIRYSEGRKKTEKREVVYQPRPEVIRLHPCEIPEGEDGYTGEICPVPEEEREFEDEGYPPEYYLERARRDSNP